MPSGSSLSEREPSTPSPDGSTAFYPGANLCHVRQEVFTTETPRVFGHHLFDTTEDEVMMERIEFDGAFGDVLSARLEMPDGELRGCALFAHCFTCSKDVLAATRISRALARHGFAVLRFDFTGLGESEGDFADTNFTSNVEDLVAAASYMRGRLQAPALLVGHSLGGAAVLRAAHDIPEVKAVCTIGAPFDPGHVAHLLGPATEDLERGVSREVTIAGRPFEIRPQFLTDISNVDARSYIGKLRKPLLVFHAPKDEVVGIENAELIFKAARHPKSYVSLDEADHMLSRAKDSEFIASVLGAWVERYVAEEKLEEMSEEEAERRVVVAEMPGQKYAQDVRMGPHQLTSDEPVSYGGADLGGSPYELLLSALGACTSMTLRMYAERKGWEIGRVSVSLDHQKIHARDCADCGEDATGMIDRIERHVQVDGELSEQQRDKLLLIANKCPVHRTLEGHPHIITDWGPRS